ncbi:MAG TPA: ribonuclease III [Candidatus Acidoferrales bacterium]|nr:ribonuclease III [Candidatus Acidoferrales bacterium]
MDDSEREALETVLGHRFTDVQWLEWALTHRSHAVASGAPNNERLEFLGDSVLGLAVSCCLVSKFPKWDEGRLSKARARLVGVASAEQAATRLGLGRHLRLGPGEEKTGGRQKQNLLADAYEAVVGAIFRDSGFDAAAAFVDRSLLYDPAMLTELLAEPDHKSAFQEWLQSRGSRPAEYRVIAEAGPEHAKTFHIAVRLNGRILAEAEGRSKKSAEQSAAFLALKLLRDEAVSGADEVPKDLRNG